MRPHFEPKRRRVLPVDFPDCKLWLRSDLGITLVADPVIGAWTLDAGWTNVGGGLYSHAGAVDHISQNILVIGNWYEITYTVSGVAGGTVQPYAGATAGTSRAADGTYTETLLCAANVSLVFEGTGTVSVGAISCKSRSVSAWADQSGNGNHATQAVAAQQPLLSTSGGPLGSPAIDYFLSSVHLRPPILNAGTSHTMFFALNLRTPAPGAQRATLDASAGRLITMPVDGGWLKLGYYDGAYKPTVVPIAGVQTNTFALDGVGGTGAVWRNGVSVGTPAYTAKALAGNVYLGGNTGSGVSSADMLLLEVAVWSRVLGADELAILHAWSNARYGL